VRLECKSGKSAQNAKVVGAFNMQKFLGAFKMQKRHNSFLFVNGIDMGFRFFDLSGFTKKVFQIITVFVSVCNIPVTFDTSIFGPVESFVQRCSNGIYTVNTTVVPFTVQIPCGATMGCDTEGWAGLVDTTVEMYSTFKMNNYDHKMYIIPAGLCQFAGLGYIGPNCTNGCRVFVPSDKLGFPSVYLHEFGHNWGLMHSWYGASEYGDLSSAMGWCCDTRCFNAAEEFKLKWSRPINVVKRSGVYTLQANEYIQLPNQSIFVQFRKDKPGLEQINQDFKDLVALYTETQLLAKLRNGETVTIGNTVVTVQNLQPTFAVVQIQFV